MSLVSIDPMRGRPTPLFLCRKKNASGFSSVALYKEPGGFEEATDRLSTQSQ
jgi:hypothetical protein